MREAGEGVRPFVREADEQAPQAKRYYEAWEQVVQNEMKKRRMRGKQNQGRMNGEVAEDQEPGEDVETQDQEADGQGDGTMVYCAEKVNIWSSRRA